LKYTILQLSQDLELSPKEPKVVAWSSCVRDDTLLWSIDRPDTIILKHDAYMRIRLGASFESNPKGIRQCWINKNDIWSEPFFGYPAPSVQAVSDGSSTSFTATSPLIMHFKGDYFKMWAYHTADSKVKLRGAFATWLELEIIPLR